MAVELNLPADSDHQEEGRVELRETVEPDQEVPESSSPRAVSMSVLTEKTGSEPPTEVEVQLEDNKPSDLHKTEEIKLDNTDNDNKVEIETKETKEENVAIREKKEQVEVKDNRRGSTFLTEVEDSEEGSEPKPRRASIVDRILAETETDSKAERVEVVEPECVEIKIQPLGAIKDDVEKVKEEEKEIIDTLGSIDEVDSKEKQKMEILDQELSNEPSLDPKHLVETKAETSDNKDRALTPKLAEETEEKADIQPPKEDLLVTEPYQPKDDESPGPESKATDNILTVETESEKVSLDEKVEVIEAPFSEVISSPTICDGHDVQSTSINTPSNVEDIGAIKDLKSEVDSLLAPLEAQIKVLEPLESDIAGSETKEDQSILESATTTAATEIEEALSEIPEMSSSISVHDMLADTDKEDTKVEDKEKKSDGALIDISVIEESEVKEKSTNDAVEEAQEAFIAEVIPDNADIEIETVEGEEVIELNFEGKDAIPLGAIAVAAFAIFLALVFYYN